MEDDILSLRQHLVNWLFTPLFLLLLFSTMTGYIAAVNLSNKPYDLVLTERARLLAKRFALEGVRPEGQPLADLFPEAEGEFYYSLYAGDGRVLSANVLLPRPRPDDLKGATPRLRDTQFNGRKVRLLTLRFSTGARQYVLQAAEPIAGRLALGRSILGNIVIPQLIFIVIAGGAVWIGLKRGFGPLERLRRQVAGRPRGDLRPLDEALAPAEVRPLIHEINALLERIRAMLESQRRFVADAAHQLRTPFAGLRAQAELARREDAVPQPLRESLERICLGAQRCSRLVNQLLTLARNEPEADGSRATTLLDLRRLAQTAAMDWAPEAVRKDIDLGLEGIEAPLPVRGDEGALRDLMDNLLDNAIRYTPAGGHVTLRLGQDPAPWLAVEDNGPGIPAELRDKVFERFWRVPGASQPGSGLGLAIVQEVARRHGAELSLAPGGQDRGAVFTVRFPGQGAAQPPPGDAPD